MAAWAPTAIEVEGRSCGLELRRCCKVSPSALASMASTELSACGVNEHRRKHVCAQQGAALVFTDKELRCQHSLVLITLGNCFSPPDVACHSPIGELASSCKYKVPGPSPSRSLKTLLES